MGSKKLLKIIATTMVLAVFLFTILSGCGSSATPSDDTTKAGVSTTSGNSSEFKVAWYASAPHPYFEDVKKGVEGFEKDFGITVEKQIGPDWKQDSETQNVEALAAKGIKYFSIYPSDGSAANGLYEEMEASGVSFVNFGSSTVEPTKAKFYVGTDVKAAAAAATEELIKAMGDKGNIINVLEVLEDANTKLRKEGVEEAVKKHPNVKIIQEISGMKSVEEAVQKIDDSISANIDKVDGIIATGDTTTIGICNVLQAYKQKGGNRAIHSIGIDTDPVTIKAIKEGYLEATISQNPYAHGYISLLLLKYMSEGWTPKAGMYRVDTGTSVVTKDNTETYNDDLMKINDEIKASLETKYLEKK